jgi:hypothetical protein
LLFAPQDLGLESEPPYKFVTVDATKFFSRRDPAPKITRASTTCGESQLKIHPVPRPAEGDGTMLGICSIEWSNRAVNK